MKYPPKLTFEKDEIYLKLRITFGFWLGKEYILTVKSVMDLRVENETN